MSAVKGQGLMSFFAMSDDLFGSDVLAIAVRTVVNAILRIALEGKVVPKTDVDPIISNTDMI